MKKALLILLALALVLTFAAGCAQEPADNPDDENTNADTERVTLTVGASPTPHAEILAATKDILAEQGIDLVIEEFNDYVIPNTAVEDGSLDANYFQHQAYLDQFNEEQGTHLVSVASIHYEPYAIYPGKTATLEEVYDGATIAVPNDGTNEGRALLLLQNLGWITLADGVGHTATVLDIVDNPMNLQIEEMEAAQITIALPDVDFAVINGNYALQAGLNANTDGLAQEDDFSDVAQTYVNVLVVKEGNEDNPAVQALAEALQSDTVRTFMEETYGGAVAPLF